MLCNNSCFGKWKHKLIFRPKCILCARKWKCADPSCMQHVIIVPFIRRSSMSTQMIWRIAFQFVNEWNINFADYLKSHQSLKGEVLLIERTKFFDKIQNFAREKQQGNASFVKMVLIFQLMMRLYPLVWVVLNDFTRTSNIYKSTLNNMHSKTPHCKIWASWHAHVLSIRILCLKLLKV